MIKVFKIIVVCWIIIAFFNIFYNSVKSYSEVKEWGNLTDYQKRYKIFGDLHIFLTLIKDKTKKNDSVLIYTKDGVKWQTFFLSLYYLYPRKITTTIDKKEFTLLSKSNKFDYIATYNSSFISDKYKRSAIFSTLKSANYGSLYKLK